MKKGKQKSNIFCLYRPLLSLLVSLNWKTNKESNHPFFVLRLAIIRKPKLNLYPSFVLWFLCSSYKALTKANNISHSEKEIRKRKSPPVHTCFLRNETVIHMVILQRKIGHMYNGSYFIFRFWIRKERKGFLVTLFLFFNGPSPHLRGSTLIPIWIRNHTPP